jgi:hypothetical protein
MSTETKDKKEELWYVWTKSERIGEIVQPLEEQKDPTWFKFTDGTQINKSLIKEFLMPARSEREATAYAKDLGLVANVKSPTQTNTTIPQTQQTKPQATERRITDGRSAPQPEVNVMMEMLKKMSRKNRAEMPVEVNIPAREVYQMLQEQMDLESDELNEQIGLLVESQIDNLREQLKEQIVTFISNYYNNE